MQTKCLPFFTAALHRPCRLNRELSPLGLSAELLVGGKTKNYRSKMACAVPLWIRGRGGNRQEEVACRELSRKAGKGHGNASGKGSEENPQAVCRSSHCQCCNEFPSHRPTFQHDLELSLFAPDKTKAVIAAFAALRSQGGDEGCTVSH